MALHTLLIGQNSQLFLWRTKPDGTRQVSWRLWLLTFLLPVLFSMGALVLAFDSVSYIQRSELTSATVSNVYAWESWTPWQGDTTTYGPVLDYVTLDGQARSASNGMSSTRWNFPIGSQQEIYYLPDLNGDVRLANFERLWAVPVTIGVIALVLWLPALIVMAVLLRWLRGAVPLTET